MTNDIDNVAARSRLAGVLAAVLVLVCSGTCSPRALGAESSQGTVILVGDVLRYNHPQIWQRVCDIANQHLSDLVVVAAASDRPKLYGDFARRALARYGVFADVAPLALDRDEFGIPFQRAVGDPELVGKVLAANGVFFVGGAPQQLARVLFDADGMPTPMAEAIARVHADGGLVVGGIPGAVGVRTGFDALDALERGRFDDQDIYKGLGLVAEGWYVDQHFFTAGRFAEVLVAMHQLGLPYALGVGVDTAVVIEGGRAEVVGDGGVIVVDLSEASVGEHAADGFRLNDIRLSYLDDGDVLDMTTRNVIPSAEKTAGFELRPNEAPDARPAKQTLVVEDMFARGRLAYLLRQALDGGSNHAVGLALGHRANGRGFRFHFRTGPDSVGWLSMASGTERFTILDIRLDVKPVLVNETHAAR